MRGALISAAAGTALLLFPALAVADDGGDLSAKELAQQAKDNFLKAKSVHLGYTDHSKNAAADRTKAVAMDLSLDRDGNCAGSLTMGKGGGSVELVKRGREVWMKPDAAFWKAQVPGPQGAAVAELFKDRYVHGTTADAMLKGMADTCDLAAFQKQVDSGVADDKTLTKGEETTRDGTKVIPLKGREDGKDSVLYVTSGSPHRLAEAAQKGAGTDVDLKFGDYDKPVPSKTPPADQTVEVDRLNQQLGS
ncbi:MULTISPECIES: hypothetical protein [Streptomyces]|uniref:Lipoprotein n=2 Tax=Streptomyces TaxID=1883 RepID=A0A2U9P7T5_STRAS|nr:MULTISPECIES: hypothetical protein [Streptomyces]AWT45048.1 hypothetical protein DMT42_23980 [Streptomyces actuosus]MBM4821614.1 hypothetical protein [Streptomyces actuosus]GHF84887.1 lipoprotein [Streptomyces griseosporeus]